jgi:hypothetical protein
LESDRTTKGSSIWVAVVMHGCNPMAAGAGAMPG